MKAAIFRGPHTFEITEREKAAPGPGEALIQIKAVGICGSDLGPYQGKDLERRAPGIVMGHEASGQVEAVGEGVCDWKPGDRVAIDPQLYCETCDYCRAGDKNLCSNLLLIGSSKRAFLDGAMCQYITLHQRHLLRLPDNVSFAEGAMLDPLGNAFRVVRRGRVGIGDTVVVTGCGAIGLMTLQTARLAGAGQVIAASRGADDRRGLAGELGADAYIETDDHEAAVARVQQLTGGRGADVVIDCAGAPASYRFSVAACRKQGTVVALGYSGQRMELPLTDLIFREITLVGSTGFAQERELLLRFLSQNKLRLEGIINRRLPLEQVEEGFRQLLAGEAIKVVLLPNG